MRKCSSNISSHRVSALVFSACVVFASVAATTFSPRPAQAASAGGSCSIITYYSDPEKTNQVGTYSNCPTDTPPRGLTGRKTAYFDVEKVGLGTMGGGGHGGGTGNGQQLPCEFTATNVEKEDRCFNIPTPRPN